MKKLYTLLLLAIFATTISYSQEFQYFTARDAYNFAQSQNSFSNKEICSIVAMEFSGTGGFYVNTPEGLATNWTFAMKSTNKSDTATYMVIVMKVLGQYFITEDSDPESNAQELVSVGNLNWKNTDFIGGEVKKSTEFFNFYTANKDNFSYRMFTLANFDVTGESPQFIWMVSVSITGEDISYCIYDAETGSNVICQVNVNSLKQAHTIIASHFPNPATGIINFNTDLIGNANVQVFDNTGILVKSTNLEINNNFQLNLSELSNGFYNVVVTSPNGTFSKKVIIAK